jgi:hypothetical protein
VPAARHQAGEQAVLGGVLVEVKRLRIELAGEVNSRMPKYVVEQVMRAACATIS